MSCSSYGVLTAIRFFKGSLLVVNKKLSLAIVCIGVILGGLFLGVCGSALRSLTSMGLWKSYAGQENDLIKYKSMNLEEVARVIISVGLLMNLIFTVFLALALWKRYILFYS